MKRLTAVDCRRYLKSGALTEPFLDAEYVLDRVNHDYIHKIKTNKDYTKIESLYNWIHTKIKRTSDMELKRKYKFQRTAREIWESGFSTGCTDWALLFATLSRQIGIPTTFLHTVEYNWLKKLKNGESFDVAVGHSFCECYYEGKWILVDPTVCEIVRDYEVKKIVLPYKLIGPTYEFVPYFRGLDLGKTMTLREHNDEQEKICKALEIN